MATRANNPDDGMVHHPNPGFMILVIAETEMFGRAICHNLLPMFRWRGDVTVFYGSPGSALGSLRPDMIINGAQPARTEFDQNWFDHMLRMRKGPHTGYLDFTGALDSWKEKKT